MASTGLAARPRRKNDRPEFNPTILKQRALKANIDWYATKESVHYRRINRIHHYMVAWYGLEAARGAYVFVRTELNKQGLKPLNPIVCPEELKNGHKEVFTNDIETFEHQTAMLHDWDMERAMLTDPMYYPEVWSVDFDGADKGKTPKYARNPENPGRTLFEESEWTQAEEAEEERLLWIQDGDMATRPYAYYDKDDRRSPQQRFEDACDAQTPVTVWQNNKPIRTYEAQYHNTYFKLPSGKLKVAKEILATPLYPAPDENHPLGWDPFYSQVTKMTGIRLAQRSDDVYTINENIVDDATIETVMTPYNEIELRTHYGMHDTLQTIAYAIVQFPQEVEKIVNLLTIRWGKEAAIKIRDAAQSIVNDLTGLKQSQAAIAA